LAPNAPSARLTSSRANPLDDGYGPLRWNYCRTTSDGNGGELDPRRVFAEGDDLYYEVRGKGPPLLMIPGGGGDGSSYAAIADILAGEFKVITFDRRGNARSTLHDPQNFEIGQQSRDAVAVLRAAGETSAFVLGNSSGAVIALDMAKTQPQAVRAIVAHEPPLARLHPHARKWQRFFAGVYYTSFRYGATLAMARFAFGIGVDFSFRQAFKAVNAARRPGRKTRNVSYPQKSSPNCSCNKSCYPSPTISRMSRRSGKTA
jgi:pimeloyl-ACP methyl ester carboxylesterase